MNSLLFYLFPFSGISSSKTLHCNVNGYYSIYESDRYGFNNPNKDKSKPLETKSKTNLKSKIKKK